MAVSAHFLNYVLGQLATLGAVRTRRMFGCVGLYCGQAFFGIIASDVLYFKVGDANRGDYEARGGRRFRPYPDRRQASMGYYEVPADVLEDGEECAAWAQRSVRVAHLKAKSPTRKPRAGRRRA